MWSTKQYLFKVTPGIRRIRRATAEVLEVSYLLIWRTNFSVLLQQRKTQSAGRCSVSITRKQEREEERRKNPYKETHQLPSCCGLELHNSRRERRELWVGRRVVGVGPKGSMVLRRDSDLFDLVLDSFTGSFIQNWPDRQLKASRGIVWRQLKAIAAFGSERLSQPWEHSSVSKLACGAQRNTWGRAS